MLAQKITLEIKAGKYDRIKTPVFVQLKKPLNALKQYELVNKKTGQVIPAQIRDSITLVFIQEKTIRAGSSVNYILQPAKSQNKKSPITVANRDNGLEVSIKNKPVLFYHTKEAIPPADSPAYYKRSGFIHPLYSPNGKILTDDFPVDHTHQHGIFMAWTNTTFRKSFIDFWNQHLKKGTIAHMDVLNIKEGLVFTALKLSLRHISLEHGDVLNEIWKITVYPFSDYFLFDLESQQKNISTDTLFLNKYHYGGLAFRGSGQWNVHDPNYKTRWNVLSSEGYKDSNANHTHARWVDVWGKIDNSTAGATVFSHPSNFRYPQAIRVHPQMPYFVYSPVVDGAFTLAPNQTYRSLYRYYVHADGPDTSFIKKLETNWVEPMEVKEVKSKR